MFQASFFPNMISVLWKLMWYPCFVPCWNPFQHFLSYIITFLFNQEPWSFEHCFCQQRVTLFLKRARSSKMKRNAFLLFVTKFTWIASRNHALNCFPSWQKIQWEYAIHSLKPLLYRKQFGLISIEKVWKSLWHLAIDEIFSSLVLFGCIKYSRRYWLWWQIR